MLNIRIWTSIMSDRIREEIKRGETNCW